MSFAGSGLFDGRIAVRAPKAMLLLMPSKFEVRAKVLWEKKPAPTDRGITAKRTSSVKTLAIRCLRAVNSSAMVPAIQAVVSVWTRKWARKNVREDSIKNPAANLIRPDLLAHHPSTSARSEIAIQENGSLSTIEDHRTCDGKTATIRPENSAAIADVWRWTRAATAAAVVAPASAESV